MANSRVHRVRKLFLFVVATITAVLGVLSLAESADAAYAPIGLIRNADPVRCHNDTVRIEHFPDSRPLAVYTHNKGKIVTLKRTKTNAEGDALVTFRVRCTLTLGDHRLGLASGKTRVLMKIDVVK